MANRFPLVIDTNDGNKIKELPAGDNLDLTQTSIVSVQDITATGTINAAVINVAGSPLVAQQFAQLEDTPSTYSGSESYFVKVNAAGDGLEFKSLSDLGTIEIDSVVVNTSLVPKVNNDADIGQNDKRFRTIWAEAARTDLVSFDGTTVFDATTGKIPYASLIGYPTQVSEFANDVGYVTSSALATDLSSVFAEGGNAQFDLKGSVFGEDSTMLVNALDSKVVGPIETSQATITVLTGTQVNTTAVAAVSITGFNSDLNITGGSSTQDVVIGDASQTSTKDVVLHNAKANAIGLGTGIGTGKLTSVTDLEFLSGNRIKVTNPTPFKMGPVSNTDKASIAPQEGDIIFNTDESEFQFYQNGAWVTFNTGDFIGSIFGDDSTVLVDAVNNLIVGDIDTASLKVTSEKIALGLSSGGSAALQVAQGTEAIAIGKEAGRTGQGNYGIAIGPSAGNSTQGQQAIAIGKATGGTSQGADAIAVGNLAGGINQGSDAVAIGKEAGASDQSTYTVAVGASAGNDAQGTSAIAVGSGAGTQSQGQSSVAVGNLAGHISQPANAVAVGRRAQYTGGSEYAVAIGLNAGYEGQGESAVAIGHDAGQTNQAANSIVINATGVETNNTTASSLVIKPIRSAVGTTIMMYDATTGEVTHTASPVLTGDITGSVFADDSTLLVDGVNSTLNSSALTKPISFADDERAIFGTGDDLQIYHNGTDSYIDDVGTGSIFIRSGTTYFQNAGGTKTSIQTNAGAGQTLYFNNNIKFETTTNGVTVTGAVTGDLIGDVTGNVTGDLVGNSSGYHTGDMTGSVFADDSTLLVDAVNAQFVGTLVGNVIGDIEGDPIMTVSTPLQTTGEVLNITTGSNQGGFVNITSDTFRHFGDDIDFQASDTFDAGSTGTTAFTYQGATNTTVLSGLYSLTSNGVTLNGGSSAVSLEGSAINLLGPVVATGDIAASAFKGSIVGDDSTIIIDGVSGKVVAPITKIIGDVQQITGPGAISLDTLVTEITTTATDDAYSLADGVVGQIKIIAMVGDGGDAVLTPTTFANGTNVTFEDVNDNITLLFTSNGWLSTANQGNPVIA